MATNPTYYGKPLVVSPAWPSGNEASSGYYNAVNSASNVHNTLYSQTFPSTATGHWHSSTVALPVHTMDPDLKTFLQLAGVTCDVQTAWLSQEAKWTIVLRHEDRHQMTANTHEENPDEFIRAMVAFYLSSNFLKAKP